MIFWDKLLTDEFHFSIQYCFRESNTAADFLARSGALGMLTKLFCNEGQLSRELQGLFRLDNTSMTSIKYS